jgi:5-methylcytosine-specific restriction endonuclease McrA
MKTVDPFYKSKQWISLRQWVLNRDQHRCVICQSDVSAPGQARVDHIKPRRQHPRLALDPANCRTLCTRCDRQAHRERTARHPYKGDRIERFTRYGTDAATGMPLDPNHPWFKG